MLKGMKTFLGLILGGIPLSALAQMTNPAANVLDKLSNVDHQLKSVQRDYADQYQKFINKKTGVMGFVSSARSTLEDAQALKEDAELELQKVQDLKENIETQVEEGKNMVAETQRQAESLRQAQAALQAKAEEAAARKEELMARKNAVQIPSLENKKATASSVPTKENPAVSSAATPIPARRSFNRSSDKGETTPSVIDPAAVEDVLYAEDLDEESQTEEEAETSAAEEKRVDEKKENLTRRPFQKFSGENAND